MGYESRLYVVQEFEVSSDKVYASIIAELNMSCVGGRVLEVFKEESKAELYGDNDTNLTYDKYGKHITSVDLPTLVKALVEDNKKYKEDNGETYRRYDIALGLLKAFDSEAWNYETLMVYHYGY